MVLVRGKKYQKVVYCGGADNDHKAGDSIEAGLPNITGRVGPMDDMSGAILEGVFYRESNKDYDATSTGEGGGWILGFNASNCSSVYGKSTTVTPPSYVVHFWQRIP